MADVEQIDDDLVDRLKQAGWSLGPWKRYPDGTVDVRLRLAPDTSGDGVRSIFGKGVNDAIRKELERLEAEGKASEP